MKFSIWYNEKEDFFDLLDEYKNHISSVYFPFPENIVNSGRAISQDKTYQSEMIKLIKKCNDYGIETIIIMNSICEGEKTGDKEHLMNVISYLKKLYKVGLSSVSVTNLLYVPFIKKSIPGITIFSSVNCYVKNAETAIYLKKIWVDVITIDRDINRDFKKIKDIKKKTSLPLQLMLNEWCIRNCPYRNIHFNIIAHWVEDNIKNEKVGKYNLIERFSCKKMLEKNRKLVFRIPFVRPEDLHHYENDFKHFKLVTRWLETSKIKLFLDAYIAWYYDGNLFDFIDMSIIDYHLYVPFIDNKKLTENGFFERISKCPWDCDKCNLCEIYFEK